MRKVTVALRALAAVAAAAALPTASSAADLPLARGAYVATVSLPSKHATQAAAADGKHVYAVSSTRVVKYDRQSGKELAKSTGKAEHLNSGFLHKGNLYCAHSNYPKKPHQSDIRVLDPETMKLEVFHTFEGPPGSLTWAERRGDDWWCHFARYGKENGGSVLVRYDGRWKETGRWAYPKELVADWGSYSLSGGIWNGDDLLATGHDKKLIYRLRVPKEGKVVEAVEAITSPFPGQGIAADAKTGGLVGIDRGKKAVLFARFEAMERVAVARDGRSFVLGGSGRRFVPWGLNYDHDEKGRLIEDYWDDEWAKVEKDFARMKKLGANVVRVHLQLGRFMDGPEKLNAKSLDRLAGLLKLAEKLGLHLDLTGLGCYHKKAVPAWYDKLTEKGRWEVQARFWKAVAARGAKSPAVFCYDLMNEPVVPGGKRKAGDWLGPAFGGKHFVQFISLDQADRPRPDIARAWVKQLAAAVRREDRNGLVTVGLVDWSLDGKGLTSGFVPGKIADDLDFVSVHIYPEKGKVAEALKTLKGFAVGKPVLIEETFPLKCSPKELAEFLDGSRKHAAGCIGFYWGKPPEELRKSKTIPDALMLAWLELFEKRAGLMKE